MNAGSQCGQQLHVLQSMPSSDGGCDGFTDSLCDVLVCTNRLPIPDYKDLCPVVSLDETKSLQCHVSAHLIIGRCTR